MMGRLNLKNFLYFLGFHFICWSLNQLARNFSNIALNGSPPAKTLLAIKNPVSHFPGRLYNLLAPSPLAPSCLKLSPSKGELRMALSFSQPLALD